MSDSHSAGFGQFVPGFEFLQGLVKSSSQAMPAMSNWVAPTLDPKELDKRIEELKAVQFWLDQNATALKATIQALEVQKMTLATLKGMNFNPVDLAQAFKPAAPAAAPAPGATARPARKAAAKTAARAGAPDKPAASAPDPMQFWGALTQQFQQIAAGAMNEVARQAAAAPAAAKAAVPKPARTSGARRR